MIATGGLLRMNRRQDSIRSKNRAENKRKRKAKKRKKNDVVVVKGKLNLCSPAGLVAAVGVVVLLVGVAMAVLGYWPHHDNQVYVQKLREQTNGKISYSKSPPTTLNRTSNKTTSEQRELVNQSNGNSSTKPPSSSGFLNDFLANYLYSDNLKVFGPLVMGIGIFFFICANAVLHENRDKKTKIINLRDIYSTVIDLHHIRTKDYSPINGLVNYSQTSRGVDMTSGLYNTSATLTRSSWPSTTLGHQGESGISELFRRPSLACRPRSWSREVQSFTETVYSIYKDHTRSSEETPQPREWETTSIVTSSVNAFTLPVIKLNNCEVEEAERTDAEEHREETAGIHIGTDGAGETQASPDHSCSTISGTKKKVPSTMDLHLPQESQKVATSEPQGVLMALPQGAQMQLLPPSPVARAMGSRLSLNSLSDQPRSARRCSLSVSGCRQGDGARRFSCPRLERSNSKGYIKLTDLGGESFEAPEVDTSSFVTDPEVATTAAEGQGAEVLVTAPSTSAEQ
ncbi:transmembrane protein 200C [Osmerus mordax]|uniref:transmembrane protein 200C n=1 Tax=Osmerus mordax TaxID=8014 RepID=UPI00350ED68E